MVEDRAEQILPLGRFGWMGHRSSFVKREAYTPRYNRLEVERKQKIFRSCSIDRLQNSRAKRISSGQYPVMYYNRKRASILFRVLEHIPNLSTYFVVPRI